MLKFASPNLVNQLESRLVFHIFGLLACLFLLLPAQSGAQHAFPKQLPDAEQWLSGAVQLPESPLKVQILFIGGVDTVQSRKGPAIAKEYHDFAGFTPDTASDDLGWLSINHETLQRDDRLGDGGGMTVCKLRRDARSDSLIIVPQSLPDGRKGRFFNVEFAGIVGETGINCGGINSAVDGRIWTAEEYLRTSNANLIATDYGPGLQDTSDFTIQTDIAGDFNGQRIRRYQNFNWMVEIDPRQAVALRKQYNWGRQSFESGVVLADNRTVLLCEDETPGLFSRFVADREGDFTAGKTFVYQQSAEGLAGKWIEINNKSIANMLNFRAEALKKGATMFNRLEWATQNQQTGKVYLTETGRDDPGPKFQKGTTAGGKHAQHHLARARKQQTYPDSTTYNDYYGRILEFDPETAQMRVYLAGGPDLPHEPNVFAYPDKHLSNPDGLTFLYTKDKTWLVICEDLNGESMGRTPRYVGNSTCEVYILDMALEPKIENLRRIAVMPLGAEATGACATPDGKTLFLNVQHPDGANPFPFNHSMTLALTGWDRLPEQAFPLTQPDEQPAWLTFDAVSRRLQLSETGDLAVYSANGKRVRVARRVASMELSDLPEGRYIIADERGRHLAIELP